MFLHGKMQEIIYFKNLHEKKFFSSQASFDHKQLEHVLISDHYINNFGFTIRLEIKKVIQKVNSNFIFQYCSSSTIKNIRMSHCLTVFILVKGKFVLNKFRQINQFYEYFRRQAFGIKYVSRKNSLFEEYRKST